MDKRKERALFDKHIDAKAAAAEAEAFRELAKEFEEGLRKNRYASFKFDYSQRRRDKDIMSKAPLRGMNINVTYNAAPKPEKKSA